MNTSSKKSPKEVSESIAEIFFKANGYTLKRYESAKAFIRRTVPDATIEQVRESAKKIAKTFAFLDKKC